VDGRPLGRLAAYAWGEDYHQTLKPLLEAIIAFIEEQTGRKIPSRWYTDTGPVLEREFAQRAGLGWIGKNTCLINPRAGSYFLLAEILLGIELELDEPAGSDYCGSCTRCIKACPTACILPDRTIDARRCISYLTIELKGEIPLDLRSQMGDWVFGCDICQEACPWNIRFAQEEGSPLFARGRGVPHADLRRELLMDQGEFSEKFRGSPVKRAGRAGYLRNVTVALGNSGEREAVPELIHALEEDVSPLVRAHAAWALGQLGGIDVIKALELARQSESDASVLKEIVLSLQLSRGITPPRPLPKST
jgi:epoxyqueuosine reductase